MIDKEYENQINNLKEIGNKTMTESVWSLKEYSETIKELCVKYGEERVKKDLGLEKV